MVREPEVADDQSSDDPKIMLEPPEDHASDEKPGKEKKAVSITKAPRSPSSPSKPSTPTPKNSRAPQLKPKDNCLVIEKPQSPPDISSPSSPSSSSSNSSSSASSSASSLPSSVSSEEDFPARTDRTEASRSRNSSFALVANPAKSNKDRKQNPDNSNTRHGRRVARDAPEKTSAKKVNQPNLAKKVRFAMDVKERILPSDEAADDSSDTYNSHSSCDSYIDMPSSTSSHDVISNYLRPKCIWDDKERQDILELRGTSNRPSKSTSLKDWPESDDDGGVDAGEPLGRPDLGKYRSSSSQQKRSILKQKRQPYDLDLSVSKIERGREDDKIHDPPISILSSGRRQDRRLSSGKKIPEPIFMMRGDSVNGEITGKASGLARDVA